MYTFLFIIKKNEFQAFFFFSGFMPQLFLFKTYVISVFKAELFYNGSVSVEINVTVANNVYS